MALNINQWEQQLITQLEEKLQCPTSDAQGFLEANEFYRMQGWGQGLTPEQAADQIIEKS
jgi:hypothetical protein